MVKMLMMKLIKMMMNGIRMAFMMMKMKFQQKEVLNLGIST